MHHGNTERGMGWLYFSNTGTDLGWLYYGNTGRGRGRLHHGNTGRRLRLVASWEYWERSGLKLVNGNYTGMGWGVASYQTGIMLGDGCGWLQNGRVERGRWLVTIQEG